MQENFSLKPYNTFGVDAQAKYFVEINSIEELRDALTFQKKKTRFLFYFWEEEAIFC